MNPSPIKQPESMSKGWKPNRTLLIVGSIVFFGGILAFVIPAALVPVGSGDTEGAWLTGFWVLCCGIPLCIIGMILLIVASYRGGKKDKRELS